VANSYLGWSSWSVNRGITNGAPSQLYFNFGGFSQQCQFYDTPPGAKKFGRDILGRQLVDIGIIYRVKHIPCMNFAAARCSATGL